MIEVRKIKYNDAYQRNPAKKYVVVFDKKPQYLTERDLKNLQFQLNIFLAPDNIECLIPTRYTAGIDTYKEVVIPDMVGLCSKCGEEISRNGKFNNHKC